MKSGLIGFAALLLMAAAQAQTGGPSGPGAVQGDPAASTATSGATSGTAGRVNPSGSGTSTSGGIDANGDQGRDKMPESNHSVRPESQQSIPDRDKRQ